MEENKYSLSVIIPVYNAETTIERCLESILGQTYKDFELILVNDGSTDKSYDFCNEYAQKDSRVTVLNIENSGPFQARKQGVMKATGEILTFSDADDWYEREAFEIAMESFCKYNPDILAYIYDNGKGEIERHLYKEKLYNKSEIRDEIIPGMMYDFAFDGRRLNPSVCCKFLKKNLFKKVTESVKDRITFGEDALITYPAVCLAESILICNKVLYHYCSNDFSCIHTYPLERVTEVKAFHENIIRLFNEMNVIDIMGHQVESYTRTFLLMMIKNWYGIELSPISFSFPFKLVPANSRVFIYGAGNVGKSYINELKITNYAKIVGWADRDYENIKEYQNVNIIAPEKIKGKYFDLLLVAILDGKKANSIIENLVNMGISRDKIIWSKPKHII